MTNYFTKNQFSYNYSLFLNRLEWHDSSFRKWVNFCLIGNLQIGTVYACFKSRGRVGGATPRPNRLNFNDIQLALDTKPTSTTSLDNGFIIQVECHMDYTNNLISIHRINRFVICDTWLCNEHRATTTTSYIPLAQTQCCTLWIRNYPMILPSGQWVFHTHLGLRVNLPCKIHRVLFCCFLPRNACLNLLPMENY